MRRTIGTVIGIMLLSSVAMADTGVALGPVLRSGDTGLRAGVDSSIFVLAAERYSSSGGDRTRGELAVRLPLDLTSRVRLAPQVGVIPIDYFSGSSGRKTLDLSVTATAALTIKLAGPLWLALEPLRAERRVGGVTAETGSTPSIPTMDTSAEWRWASWAALRVGW
jgi:hypothetical protein